MTLPAWLSDTLRILATHFYENRITYLALFVALLRSYRDWQDQPTDGVRKNYLYVLFGLVIQVLSGRGQAGTGQLSGRVAKLEDLIAQVLARLPPPPGVVTREDPGPPPPAPVTPIHAGSVR